MPFFIKEGDITKEKTDAIVNAANNSLLGGGGVDGSIHRAAGPELLKECRTLGGCDTGDAKITNAYNLPSEKVIHTVGPIWYGGSHNEEELLRNCYKKSLALAKENNIKSVSFPLISAGIYGYPKDQALRIATEEIDYFLESNDMDIYLMIYNRSDFNFDKELAKDLKNYIKDNYLGTVLEDNFTYQYSIAQSPKLKQTVSGFGSSEISQELDEIINNKAESFSDFLLRKIDEAKLTDPECYKKANIDRRLFSKIKNNKNYNPSKETVLALALALELSLEETNELLEKAGYSLSDAKLSDVIIKYYIEKGIYNIYKVNEALFYYNQKLLGS